MTHFIDIKDDNNKKQLSSLDLPLVILVTEDKGSVSIRIEKINTEEQTETEIVAYLAEDDGHLFLQPESVKYDIFHNDELIKKSVWIKSGDQLNIQNKIISFKISGDKIHIAVFKEPELVAPPPMETIHLKKPETSYIEKIEQPVSTNEASIKQDKSSSITKNILLIGLVILVLIAGFVLFARTVTLNVEPEPDTVDFNGLLPAVKIGPNYIMLSGSYELYLDKKGYRSIRKKIEVNSEHTRFDYKMRKKPGLVKFNIKPDAGNKLYIDNVLLEKQSPDSPWYRIEAGSRHLSIKNKRYKLLEEAINIKGKEEKQQYDFELVPDWGMVSIKSQPDKAKIIITPLSNKNETRKELRTPIKLELLSGQYQLDLSKDKYKAFRKIISIAAGTQTDVEMIKLDPLPANITFVTQPESALLQVDGQYAGRTPVSVPLSAFKEHSFSLSRTGYKSYKGKITPDADEQKKLDIKLTADKGTVFISTSPKQAQLYIDGKRQAQSSGSFYLTDKQHTITVKAKGYVTQSRTINPRNYTTNLNIVLNKTGQANAGSTPSKVPGIKTSAVKKINTKNLSTYTNKLGQKMILLQPAQFTMGSANNEIGRRSNERLHSVKITYPYYLSETEVTNKQFKQFNPQHNSEMSLGQSLDRGVQPVVNVSWNEAAEFANWLSRQEGLLPFYEKVNGKMRAKKLSPGINGYRLPYESEWSYAARGRSHQKYPWKGSFPPPDMSGNFADESVSTGLAQYIEGYNDKHKVTAPVATYSKNSFGFYDMGGNVSEWCQDYYSPNSGFGSKTLINPTGPEKGTHHVVRDASWRDASITELRLSYRNYSKKKANDIGFRLARYAQ